MSDPELNARTAASTFEPTPQTSRCSRAGAREERAELIAQRLRRWTSAANAF